MQKNRYDWQKTKKGVKEEMMKISKHARWRFAPYLIWTNKKEERPGIINDCRKKGHVTRFHCPSCGATRIWEECALCGYIYIHRPAKKSIWKAFVEWLKNKLRRG
jgi:hypothetical protein